MKILMALMSLDIGGVETHVLELSKELVARGHKIVVASAGGSYVAQLEASGVHHVTAPLVSKKPGDIMKSYKILKSLIKEFKPDIVHSHARIPSLVCHLIHKTDKSFKFVTSVHFPFDTRIPFRWLSRWGERTLAVSEDLKGYVTRNYNVKDKNVFVSINGIDTEKFSPRLDSSAIMDEFGLEEDAVRIVYVSRLDTEVCTPAFAMLDKFIEIDEQVPGIQLVIAGRGTGLDALKRKAAEINARLGRIAVVLTGPRTDINLINHVATFCVGVSRSALEGMAEEKPCILAGNYGYMGIFKEEFLEAAIENNFTCRSFSEVDAERLKNDIITLCRMPKDEFAALGEYSRKVVISNYSVARMADDNLKMYASVYEKREFDAVMLGYYGYKNSGDDALLHSIVSSLKIEKPDISLLVLSNTPAETARVYKVSSISRYSILKIRKALKNTKLFIMGGGSLLQDSTSTKSLLYYLYVLRMAQKLGVKTMLYSNGIGPIIRKSNRRRVRKALDKTDVITLRDSDSFDTLVSIGANTERAFVTADPVFGMSSSDGDFYATDILNKYGIGDGTKFACIAVRKWQTAPDNFEDLCAKMCDYIYEKHGLLPVLLPMQYPYDAGISRGIIKKMKNRGVFISERLDIPVFLGILKQSALTVSVRLHLLVYSALMNVPFVGIAYDPKVSNFHNEVELPYFIDPRALDAGDYTAVVDSCIENSEEIRAQLKKKSAEFSEKAEETAKLATEIINS